jgi:outer membrane biosynthesis protein TonB
MRARDALGGMAFVVVVGCATAASRKGPAGEVADDKPVPPPVGTKRLPSSLQCEPEPPCPDCVTATGDQARLIGSLDKEVIRGVFRSHIAEVKACYDAVAATHPDASGALRVRFGIAPSGAVETSCLVSSELNDAAVERCVVELLLSWKFPAPDGGGWVAVTYPFQFSR